MIDQASPHSTDAYLLDELAGLGMRVARALTRLVEIELAAAEVVAVGLPVPGVAAPSRHEETMAAIGVDGLNLEMEQAVPRAEILARAFDRVARSVRRTVALRRRVAAGWPRACGPGNANDGADDRAAMVRRQVARGVGEAILRTADGEAVERLFDDLAERLDDPGLEDEIRALPVEQVVRRICSDFGLAAAGLTVGPRGARPDGDERGSGISPVDTG